MPFASGHTNPHELLVLPETGMFRDVDFDTGVGDAERKLGEITENFDIASFMAVMKDPTSGGCR